MRIAFYAPMKPPDSDVPSGDREASRLLVGMLRGLGHEVDVPSRLVTWRARPEVGAVEDLRRRSAAEAARIVEGRDRPDLWLTYHLYHKAPDWLGPQVATTIGIPYVVVEASRTARLAEGPWADGLSAADAALDRADAVAAVHSEDAEGLQAVVEPARLHLLPPAVDASRFPTRLHFEDRPPVLLAVGMMREGDKLASYQVLGQALSRLLDREWSLIVAGDGPAREAALGVLPAERVQWRGALAREELGGLYAQADIFVWPAVNEAYGMALLEAQAAGLPAVAGRSGGVPDIVADGETGFLAPEGDAAAFAARLARLLDDAGARRRMGEAARMRVRDRHDLPVARERLSRLLDAAFEVRAARKAGPGA